MNLRWCVLAGVLSAGTLVSAQNVTDTAALIVANLTKYPTARCLDGTGFAYYYRAGAGPDADKWVLMLEGGGFCYGIDDCMHRSHGHLGSSANYSSTMDLSGISFMTSDKANPFRLWNQVYVRYCDGSMWMGNRTDNNDPQTGGLWVSGHNSIAALIDHLSFGMDDENAHHKRSIAAPGSTVILSGGSAGGIGAFNNVDFVAAQLPNSFVLGAPVGGFPPAVNWYTGPNAVAPEEDARDSAFAKNEQFWGTYKPEKCVSELAPLNQTVLCNVPYHLYDHLATPVFIVEAITDAVVMCGFEGLACKPADLLLPEVQAFINDYAHNFTLSAARVSKDTPRNGLFAASCLMHTGFLLDAPVINDTNAVTALHHWYEYQAAQYRSEAVDDDQNFVWIDQCKNGRYFPTCDAKCPPTPSYSELHGPHIF